MILFLRISSEMCLHTPKTSHTVCDGHVQIDQSSMKTGKAATNRAIQFSTFEVKMYSEGSVFSPAICMAPSGFGSTSNVMWGLK